MRCSISCLPTAVCLVATHTQVDCSNRGLCDYFSGTCTCFEGYYGLACEYKSALAKGL